MVVVVAGGGGCGVCGGGVGGGVCGGGGGGGSVHLSADHLINTVVLIPMDPLCIAGVAVDTDTESDDRIDTAKATDTTSPADEIGGYMCTCACICVAIDAYMCAGGVISLPPPPPPPPI